MQKLKMARMHLRCTFMYLKDTTTLALFFAVFLTDYRPYIYFSIFIVSRNLSNATSTQVKINRTEKDGD